MTAHSDIGRFGGNGPILPLLFFLAPLVTSVLPRLTPLFFPLIGLALLLPSLWRGRSLRELLPSSRALIACLVLSLYVFINALWAADQAEAHGKAAILLGAILIVFAAMPIVASLDERQIRRAAFAFAAGAAIGAVYLLLELHTQAAFTRAVLNNFVTLPEQAKRLVIVDGEVRHVSLNVFNQNATLLMFHLWPGLLILTALKPLRRRVLAIALFFVTIAAAILGSDHDSSQLALLGSILVFILAWYWPRLVTRALAVLWCLGFLLVLPANFLVYAAGMHLAEPLPVSYKARIIIWEYTAERVLENPVLGIGVNATPKLRQAPAGAPPAEQPEDFVIKRTTGHHAHNIFLQTWYELGGVGAVLLALAGALIALRIDVLPRAAQPFAAASFAAFALIAAFAWGMWQTWFMCGIALLPLYLALASAKVRERSPRQAG